MVVSHLGFPLLSSQYWDLKGKEIPRSGGNNNKKSHRKFAEQRATGLAASRTVLAFCSLVLERSGCPGLGLFWWFVKAVNGGVAIQWLSLETTLIELRRLPLEEGTCCCFQVQRSAIRSAESLLCFRSFPAEMEMCINRGWTRLVLSALNWELRRRAFAVWLWTSFIKIFSFPSSSNTQI